MVWQVSFADSGDEAESAPEEGPRRAVAASSTRASRARARSRSPVRQDSGMGLPAVMPGTETWAPKLAEILEPLRQARGQQLRPITVEVDCCGTLPEYLIGKAVGGGGLWANPSLMHLGRRVLFIWCLDKFHLGGMRWCLRVAVLDGRGAGGVFP